MVECPNVITCHQRVGQCSREMMPFSAFSIVSSLGVLGTQQWLLSVLLNPYILLTYPSCKVCFVHKPMTRERGWQISIPQIFLSTWLIRNSFSGKPLCEIHLDKNILIPSTHSQIVAVVIACHELLNKGPGKICSGPFYFHCWSGGCGTSTSSVCGPWNFGRPLTVDLLAQT